MLNAKEQPNLYDLTLKKYETHQLNIFKDPTRKKERGHDGHKSFRALR